MKERWKKMPIGAKVGLGVELIALAAMCILIILGRQVPSFVLDAFFLGAIVSILANVYHKNHK